MATANAGASASGNFSLARDAEDLRGRIGLNLHHQRLVPGAAPPESKTASKNAKKRSRAKVPVSALGPEPPLVTQRYVHLRGGLAARGATLPHAASMSSSRRARPLQPCFTH